MTIEQLGDMIGDGEFQVPGLGVIICKDGAEVYSKFLGRRTINPNKPVTRQTRFRAASVSKMFTVFSLLQLAEQNKLDLDADVSNYLGFELRNPHCPHKIITPRNLASHTSSLRDGKIYSTPPDVNLKEFFTPDGRFWEDGAHFAPDAARFAYCNLNYGLLGTIIERISSERFDLFQKNHILRQLDSRADYVPANFSAADFELLGTTYRKQTSDDTWQAKADDFKAQPPKDTLALQNPYDENFQHVCNLKAYRAGSNATIFSPQGGLRISFEELAHALEMLINGGNFRGKQILSRESLAQMCKPHWTFDGNNGDTCGGAILNYGLGIYRIDGKKNNRVCKEFAIDLIGHTGAAFGMLAGLFFIPNTQSGFVYMMNGTALDPDVDPKAKGTFSDNYIWEEQIMGAICKFLVPCF